MSDEKTYLAFDLGASSGRCILGRLDDDGTIRLEELHRFPNGPVADGDGLFWDIDAIFAEMLRAMSLAAQRGVEPAAIGVDTWGVDFGLLDERGRLLARPRCYRDRRNTGMSGRIVERIGAERLLRRTGSMHQDHASLCQLAALAENEGDLLGRARLLLFIPDLLRRRLCGDETTDATIASTSQMYDSAGRTWACDILAELGLPADILPPIAPGPSVAGVLRDSVRERTGLGASPVVRGAGHDTGAAFGLCRNAAAPPADDLAVLSSGTWSVLGAFVEEQLPPGRCDPTRFGYEANPDGSLRIVRNLTGAWLLEQCRRAWSAEGANYSHESLIDAAHRAGGPGASGVIDPQWAGFVNPPSMPEAIAEFCRSSGQRPPATPGEFARVIFVSLADSYAACIAELREMTGRPLGNLYLMGGMSRNGYLNELTAERAGVNVIIGPAEASASGNVAVQVQALANAPAE